MLKLMQKDITVVTAFGWLIVWLVVPSYLVPATAAARTGGVFLWVNVAFGAMMIASVCLLDARNGADRFIHSLPVTRTDVVLARYGTALVLTAVALAAGAAIAVVRGLASVSAGGDWPRWIAPDVVLAYLIVMAVVISVYLPCYFRWGYGAGTVVAASLLAGIIIAADVAGGWMEIRPVSGSTPAILPRGLAVRLTAAAVGQWGLVAASIAGMAAAGALLAGSAALAVRAYRDRQF